MLRAKFHQNRPATNGTCAVSRLQGSFFGYLASNNHRRMTEKNQRMAPIDLLIQINLKQLALRVLRFEMRTQRFHPCFQATFSHLQGNPRPTPHRNVSGLMPVLSAFQVRLILTVPDKQIPAGLKTLLLNSSTPKQATWS